MTFLDDFFFVLLLVGAIFGLLCVIVGIYLLIKRFAGRTEINIPIFGTLKTAESGVAVLFIGVFLFAFSIGAFAQTRKLEVQTKKVDALTSQVDALSVEAAGMLREAFRQKDFSSVEILVNLLFGIDRTSGHALYYAGELKRARGMRPESHREFYRYLDIEATLLESERGGGIEAEICYQRAKGYCKQRAAWIHHLLANDFYRTALKEMDESNKRDWLMRALKQAKAAMSIFPGGFVQHIPTSELKREIAAALTAIGEEM